MRRRHIPVVHLSADYVFDGTKSSAYLETDSVAPINSYGRSKLAGEVKLRETHEKHVIIRTAWVYSPLGANFLKTMLRVGSPRPKVTGEASGQLAARLLNARKTVWRTATRLASRNPRLYRATH
jgi:dTDP-4-dehydrorhamnose reductase